MTGIGKKMGGLIGRADNGTLNQVRLSFEVLKNNYDFGGVGALIGETNNKNIIQKVSVTAKEVTMFSYHEYFGGLVQNATDLTVEDVYLKFDSLRQTSGNRNYSGGLIGSSGSNSKIDISKAVILLSDFAGHGMSLAGFIGKGESPNITINNSIVISEDPLYGMFGTLSQNPRLQNIIILSPQTQCDQLWIGEKGLDNFALTCSSNDNVFFHTAGVCDNERCGEPLMDNGKDILGRLQDSSNFEWMIQTVHVGGEEIKAPVFTSLLPIE